MKLRVTVVLLLGLICASGGEDLSECASPWASASDFHDAASLPFVRIRQPWNNSVAVHPDIEPLLLVIRYGTSEPAVKLCFPTYVAKYQYIQRT